MAAGTPACIPRSFGRFEGTLGHEKSDAAAPSLARGTAAARADFFFFASNHGCTPLLSGKRAHRFLLSFCRRPDREVGRLQEDEGQDRGRASSTLCKLGERGSPTGRSTRRRPRRPDRLQRASVTHRDSETHEVGGFKSAFNRGFPPATPSVSAVPGPATRGGSFSQRTTRGKGPPHGPRDVDPVDGIRGDPAP